MNDIPLTLFSGGAIAATTILVTFFTWLANRTVAHQEQIKNLGVKIDHIDEKLDIAIKNMDKVDDRHRQDMKEMKEAHKEMDSKWERLFERLLIQDKERGR